MNNLNVIRCFAGILGLTVFLPVSPLKATPAEPTQPNPTLSEPGHEEVTKVVVGNVPDCSSEKVVKDTWLLRIPESDLLLKENLFTILKLASFKGFGVNTVPYEATNELDLFIYFNEKAFLTSDTGPEKTVDTKSAELVKTKILQALAEVIKPAKLSCVDLATPELESAPAMASIGMASEAAPNYESKSSECSMDNLSACFDPEKAGGVTGSNGCRIDDPIYINPGGTDNLSGDLEDKIRDILGK